MVFGRSPNLALGLLTGLWNVLIIFHIGGLSPSVEQNAAINALLGAAILFVANVPEFAITSGMNAISRMNDSAPAAQTPGTDLANKSANGNGVAVVNTNPTPPPAVPSS